MSRMSFRTEVNGSFSRPDWLLEGYRLFTAGKLDKASYDSMVEDALKLTIKEQELTGVDVITDGEQERTSFVGYLGSRLPGFTVVPRSTLNASAEAKLKEMKTLLTKIRAVCVDTIADGDLGVADYDRAKEWAEPANHRELKVSLPAPYLVMWETWHSSRSAKAYPDPVDMARDYAKVLRGNVLRLYSKGLRFLTLDEPMVGDLTEADETPDRYHQGLTMFYGQKYRGFKPELRLGVELLNLVLEGLPSDLYVTVHMDRWPIRDSPHYNEGYERFLPELLEVKCGQMDFEYGEGCGDPKLIARPFSENDKALGLGCVSVTDTRVESPHEIVAKVEQVVPILGPENIMLVPNCGFAPGMGKKFPRDAAFAKLKSMVRAANLLRERAEGQ